MNIKVPSVLVSLAFTVKSSALDVKKEIISQYNDNSLLSSKKLSLSINIKVTLKLWKMSLAATLT